MSERNGDKARFQRQRKAGLRRRERARAALAAMRLTIAARAEALGQVREAEALEDGNHS